MIDFLSAARLGMFASLMLVIVGCASSRLEPYSEVVMSPGTRIEASNQNGTVSIAAGEGTRRLYGGQGWSESKLLTARHARWDGSLGLYDPGAEGGPRLMVEEGRLYFSSVDEALRWLYVGSLYPKPVYRNDGLVFSYSVVRAQEAWQCDVRDVKIWQIYINGKRPTSIPGADDRAIKVSGGSIPDTSQPHDAPIGSKVILGKRPYDPMNPPTGETD